MTETQTLCSTSELIDMTSIITKSQSQSPDTTAVPALAMGNGITGKNGSGLSEKAVTMRSLIADVPLNHLGLPEYIYRADIVPGDLYSSPDYTSTEVTDLIEQAVLELDYSQGYPTLDNTEPFWGKLPYESINAYNAFVAYMDLPRSKESRHVSTDLTEHPLKDFGTIVPVRQLHLLKNLLPQDADHLLDYYHIYQWPMRTRAYDLFHVAHHNKLKEHRLANVEDKHFTMATKFLDYAQNQLEIIFTNPEEYGLKPKEVMDLMVSMMKVQRLSAGATPFGSTQVDKHALPQNASMEVMLRTIVQQAGAETVVETGGSDPTKLLMQDPDAMALAQELFIKMNASKTGDRTINADFAEISGSNTNTNTNTDVIDATTVEVE